MFLKPKHFLLECRPNFGSFCPLPGPLRAIVSSAPNPALYKFLRTPLLDLYLFLMYDNANHNAGNLTDHTMLISILIREDVCMIQRKVIIPSSVPYKMRIVRNAQWHEIISTAQSQYFQQKNIPMLRCAEGGRGADFRDNYVLGRK